MSNYITGKKQFDTVKQAKNTTEYVVARLVDLGITHAFTVPGDFAFTLDHALEDNAKLTNIGSANELNASYSADGYAREKGAAILSTTYGVGELSALNGMMGAKAENNIIFHLVGSPSSTAVAQKKIVHHTLGDGIFGQFNALSAAATCVSAVITPDNAVREMNRVIQEAFKYREPAYINVSLDQGKLPVTDQTKEENYYPIVSQKENLNKAIHLILESIQAAKSIVILPALKLDRFGLTKKAIQLIEKLNVPFAIMPADKSVIDQNHPNYLGFYCGKLSDPGVSEIVESADLIIDLGQVYWSDFNTAGFTNHLDIQKVLTLAPLFVKNKNQYFTDIGLEEVLDGLLKGVNAKNYTVSLKKPSMKNAVIDQSAITLDSFYAQLMPFIQKGDSLIVETGSSSFNLPRFPLPSDVKYHNQTLWGSIGWATPAAFGVALASPERRAILVTGEGSHQLTLNELGVMGRYGVNIIIICINNQGYLIERGLEVDPNPKYDDIAQLNYAKLPEAFGCSDWLSFKVTDNQSLSEALQKARQHTSGTYIELISGKYDYGEALAFYHEHLKELYG